jgi:hypothetical protein
MEDQDTTQIVNGIAGIGKSSFLLYMLARMRFEQKSVLLHYHRDKSSPQKAVFFSASGTATSTFGDNDYSTKFEAWYKQVGKEKSVFLVDGIVSFVKDDV